MGDLRTCNKKRIDTTILYLAQAAQERLRTFSCQARVAREVAASVAEGGKNVLTRCAGSDSIANVRVNRLSNPPARVNASRCVSDWSAVAPTMLKHPSVFVLCQR